MSVVTETLRERLNSEIWRVRRGETRDTGSELVVVRSRRPLRWLILVVFLLVAAALAESVATNAAFQWGTFADYFFSEPILSGVKLTIELTAAAMAIGIALGIVLAMFRLSKNPLLSGLSWAYAWFFRGVPTLVLLIFFFNLGALYPHITLKLPFLPALFSANTNDLITPFVAGILGLGFAEGAYMSEIVRGGIMSVGPGQTDAAMGLGMTRAKTFRRVVLPQAMRVIVPPTFNNIIGMLKYSSLVSVLSISDLLFATEQVYSRNFQPIPLLIVASIWYLICTTVLMIAQRFIEKRLSRGYG